jgi:hypothetical protein
VPSKPPPLPHPPFSSTPWWISPPAGPPKPLSLHWPAILVSASLSLALVIGVVAWIVAHPNKPMLPAEAMSLADAAPAVETPAVPPAPAQPTPVIEAKLVFHRPPQREGTVNNLALVEEEPPPLPPPTAPQPKHHPAPAVVEAASAQPAGETYGTQVLFLNDLEMAGDQARHDHKLLFVMHISGNFEESCFT